MIAGGGDVGGSRGGRGVGGAGGVSSSASASPAASSEGILSGPRDEQVSKVSEGLEATGLHGALQKAFGHDGPATGFSRPRAYGTDGRGGGGLSVDSLTSSWHSSRSPDFGSIGCSIEGSIGGSIGGRHAGEASMPSPQPPPPLPALEAAPDWVAATAEQCRAETPLLPCLLPEQKAGWLPGCCAPRLIEHHVSASLACAAGFDSLGTRAQQSESVAVLSSA